MSNKAMPPLPPLPSLSHPPKSTPSASDRGVVVERYIQEWVRYPDGSRYFRKQYPIGTVAAKMGEKAKKRSQKVKSQRTVAVETQVEERSLF